MAQPPSTVICCVTRPPASTGGTGRWRWRRPRCRRRRRRTCRPGRAGGEFGPHALVQQCAVVIDVERRQERGPRLGDDQRRGDDEAVHGFGRQPGQVREVGRHAVRTEAPDHAAQHAADEKRPVGQPAQTGRLVVDDDDLLEDTGGRVGPEHLSGVHVGEPQPALVPTGPFGESKIGEDQGRCVVTTPPGDGWRRDCPPSGNVGRRGSARRRCAGRERRRRR